MSKQEIIEQIEVAEREIAQLEAQRTFTGADATTIEPTLVALRNRVDNLRAALSAC